MRNKDVLGVKHTAIENVKLTYAAGRSSRALRLFTNAPRDVCQRDKETPDAQQE